MDALLLIDWWFVGYLACCVIAIFYMFNDKDD